MTNLRKENPRRNLGLFATDVKDDGTQPTHFRLPSPSSLQLYLALS